MTKQLHNSQPAIELKHQQSFFETACETLQEGHKLRFTLTGGSMLPFLKAGVCVEISPLSAPASVGDVVLYKVAENKLILHRLHRIMPECYLCRGDAHRGPREEVEKHEVLGRLTQLQKSVDLPWKPYGRFQQKLALVWSYGYPVLFPLIQTAGRLRQHVWFKKRGSK